MHGKLPSRQVLRTTVPVALLLCVLLALTLLLWQREHAAEQRQRQERAELMLSEIAGRLAQRMQGLEQLLRGVQGLHGGVFGIGRAEFRSYAEALWRGGAPGLQGLGLALLVAPADLASHQAALRQQGLPGYAVWPAGARDRYAPLVQMEPGARGRAGYDGLTDAARRAAMDQARDSGQLVFTRQEVLLQEFLGEMRSGFVMVLPLYRPGFPVDTVEQRQRQITGWVVAPFTVPQLVRSAGIAPEDGWRLQIFDAVAAGEPALLYATAGAAPAHAGEAPLAVTRSLLLAGRPWTLQLQAQSGTTAAATNGLAPWIAWGGLLLSFGLAGLAWWLQAERARLRTAAEAVRAELREATDHFALILEASPDGMLISWFDNNQVLEVNGGFTALTGYTRDEVTGRSLLELPIWADAEQRERYLQELLRHGGCDNLEVQLVRKDGQRLVGMVSAQIAAFRGHPGVVAVVRDITARKAAEERIAHMAQHDGLTGLPNRALLQDRLQQAMARAQREGHRLALLYVDLDRLKPINDSLGHQVGDLLLKAVARRLQECIRASDTAARVGGDEFVVLLAEVGDARDALQVGNKIRVALTQTFDLAGVHQVHISSSIGIAIFPDHGEDQAALTRAADEAMYRSKAGGRDRVELHAPVVLPLRRSNGPR